MIAGRIRHRCFSVYLFVLLAFQVEAFRLFSLQNSPRMLDPAFRYGVPSKPTAYWPLRSAIFQSNINSDVGGAQFHSENKRKPQLQAEVLSAIVVSLANLPASIAYSSILGAPPLVGLWSSVIFGGVLGLFCNCPGLIGAAASASYIPLGRIYSSFQQTSQLGAAAVQYTLLVSSCFLTLYSVFDLGKLIALVELSHPAIIGFLNALGLAIAKSQLSVFSELTGNAFLCSWGIALGTFSFIRGFPPLCSFLLPPQLSTALSKIPASLFAVPLATVLVSLLGLPAATLIDVAGPATFRGGFASLPQYHGFSAIHQLGLAGALQLLPTALSVSLITYFSLIATKATAAAAACEAPPRAAAAATAGAPTSRAEGRGGLNRVLRAMALGNAASAAWGGAGGCAIFGLTALNARAGGRGRAGPLAQPAALALGLLALGPRLGALPVAALAGLLFDVALGSARPRRAGALLARAASPSSSPGVAAEAGAPLPADWRGGGAATGGGAAAVGARVDALTMVLAFAVAFGVDMPLGIVVGYSFDWLARKVLAGATF